MLKESRVSSLGLLLFLPATVWARTNNATIAGVVKDTSGAVLPGVAIQPRIFVDGDLDLPGHQSHLD